MLALLPFENSCLQFGKHCARSTGSMSFLTHNWAIDARKLESGA
jgi:hypothetical protein